MDISEINSGIVFGFLEQKTLLDHTRRVYKCQLLAYLDFLFECGQIGFDPELLRIKPISNVKPIPEQARAFIESSRGHSAAAVAAVRNFHQWLNDNELELQNLSPTIFSVHLEGRLKSVAPSTGIVYRLQLLAYLEFQYQASHINFDPATLRDKPKESPIPENCRLLLESKSPSMTSIARVFHVWLNSKNLTPADLTVFHFKEFHDSRLENLSELTVRNSENKGPLVVEVPPKVLGAVNDFWYRWVADVGITGEDKGKGGKYLVLPPGYKGKIPSGYTVMRPSTYGNWLFFRAVKSFSS